MKTNKLNMRNILKTTISGVVFTIIFISIVVVVGNLSSEKIKDNQKQQLLQELEQLVQGYDNDILKDSYTKEIYIYGGKNNLL